MEFSGQLRSISRDITTGEFLITVSTRRDVINEYEALKDKELDIKMAKYRKKRSRDANAYFHVLVGKMAEVLGTSIAYMKNLLLRRYGQYQIINGHLWEMTMRDDIEVEELEHIHLAPTSKTTVNSNGIVFRSYLVIAGSHTYDTAQMSHLIENTVEEAKELGIETATPEEIRRMEEKWGMKFEKCSAS